MGAAQGIYVYFWESPIISMLTRFSREEVYDFYCNHWKKYENQKIDRRAFVKIYNSFTGAKITVEVCDNDNIYKRIEKKGNGNISLRDIMMAFNKIADGSEEEKLRWAFKVYDTNNDGFISTDELTDIIYSFTGPYHDPRKTIVTFSRQDAKRVALAIMRKVDDNNDGKVSWKEFKKYSTVCPDIVQMVRRVTGYKK